MSKSTDLFMLNFFSSWKARLRTWLVKTAAFEACASKFLNQLVILVAQTIGKSFRAVALSTGCQIRRARTDCCL